MYVHINKINGKIYIGQTNGTLESRSGIDGKGYRNCTTFYQAIKKYGWDNFKHIMLIENLTKTEVDIIEAELIRKYDSVNLNKGYNTQQGNIRTEEERLKTNKPRESGVIKTFIFGNVKNEGYKKSVSQNLKPKQKEMARKAMSIQIEESLQDTFREKCKSEKLKYSEVAEALLQAYVNGEIHVQVETKYKVTPKDL